MLPERPAVGIGVLAGKHVANAGVISGQGGGDDGRHPIQDSHSHRGAHHLRPGCLLGGPIGVGAVDAPHTADQPGRPATVSHLDHPVFALPVQKVHQGSGDVQEDHLPARPSEQPSQ